MVKSYVCNKVDRPLLLDGKLTDPLWLDAPWTDDFIDIRGADHPEPRFKTRAKMLWCAEYFYFAAEMEEPHVWGTLTEKNSIIYHDNDFEIFIDPDGDGLNYYEFEVNALGTIWELTLDKAYNKGGTPTLGTNIAGLVSKVFAHGPVNNPQVENGGWSVEVAIPWSGLAKYQSKGTCPPEKRDTWKINFSRVQWRHQIVEGAYVRVPEHGTEIPWTEHPEDNWVWSPQGEINMHIPAQWGEVEFHS